jgi:PAS domain S-box-containing protein
MGKLRKAPAEGDIGFPLTDALEGFSDGFFILDDDLVVRFFNSQSERLLGKRKDEVLGHRLFEAFPEARGSVFEEMYRKGLRERTPLVFETFFGIEPYVNWYEVRVSPFPKGIAVYFQVTTERKRIEDALREKTQELGRFFSYALDLFCIADMEGRFIRLNPQWAKVLGYRIEDLEGRSFLDLVHPEDKAATLRSIEALDSQDAVLGFVNRYRAASGEWRWIEWNSFPAGRLIYAAARDITERMTTEAALKAALAEKELLLRELGHRVKNSLAVIASLVSIESGRIEEGESAKEGFERLQSRIEATSLLYDKLSESRTLTEVDAADYLGDLATIAKQNLAPEGARMELRLDHLALDAKRAIALGLAANEAITNAYKYAFAGGRAGIILIELSVTESQARFAVSDDGPGFKEGFDPAADGDFGFRLIALEAAELRGKLEIGPGLGGPSGPGARLEIVFPAGA